MDISDEGESFMDEKTSVSKQKQYNQRSEDTFNPLIKGVDNLNIQAEIMESQDEQSQNQVTQKTIRLVLVGERKGYDKLHFNNLEFNQFDKVIEKKQLYQYDDPIIDACNNQDLFNVSYDRQKDQYFLTPMKPYIIQFEINEQVELVQGSCFIIGETLFEVTIIDNNENLKINCALFNGERQKEQTFKTCYKDYEDNIFKIGRESLQILNKDKYVSRKHGEIIKKGSQFFIYKSNKLANKMWYCVPNQQKLQLSEGMNIRIGLTCERQIKIMYS